jgi:2'-5' RNA ligase
MVALWPSTSVAKKLQGIGQALVKGSAEDVEDIHLTLGFLGTTTDLTPAQLAALPRTVARLAKAQGPLSGVLGGIGRFGASKNSGGKDVLWAAADLPELPAFRHKLVSALDRAGVPVKTDHGFTPHLTLAYMSPQTKVALPHLDPIPVRFNTVVVAVGGKQTRYPLKG